MLRVCPRSRELTAGLRAANLAVTYGLPGQADECWLGLLLILLCEGSALLSRWHSRLRHRAGLARQFCVARGVSDL